MWTLNTLEFCKLVLLHYTKMLLQMSSMGDAQVCPIYYFSISAKEYGLASVQDTELRCPVACIPLKLVIKTPTDCGAIGSPNCTTLSSVEL